MKTAEKYFNEAYQNVSEDAILTIPAKNLFRIMEEYAEWKVNKLNKSDIIKSVCPKCKSYDWDGMGQYRRCNKCNERWIEGQTVL